MNLLTWRLLLSLGLGAGLTAGAFGQETSYTLKGSPRLAPGFEAKSTVQVTMEDGNMIVTSTQGAMNIDVSIKTNSVTTHRVDSVKNGEPTGVTSIFVKDLTTTKMTMGKESQSEDEHGPLEGETVISRLEGGTWVSRLQKGTPTAAQEKKLASMSNAGFSNNDEVYPDHAVSIGESWTVSAADFKQLIAPDALDFNGTLKCRLSGVEEYNGIRCAVITVQMDAKGTQLDDENYEMDMIFNLTGVFYRSLDDLLDVHAELNGNTKFESERVEGGQTQKMKIVGPMTITQNLAYEPVVTGSSSDRTSGGGGSGGEDRSDIPAPSKPKVPSL